MLYSLRSHPPTWRSSDLAYADSSTNNNADINSAGAGGGKGEGGEPLHQHIQVDEKEYLTRRFLALSPPGLHAQRSVLLTSASGVPRGVKPVGYAGTNV